MTELIHFSRFIECTPKTRTVLLIHGLEQFRFTLSLLTYRFRTCGWNVLRFQYNSHRLSLYDVAEVLHKKIHALPSEQYPEYAIGYSLGGVILAESIRLSLQLQRALFLGSPLLNSYMAQLSLNIPGTRRFFGPALVELAQARSPTFPSHIELATIAGIGPLWKRTNPLLPFPNDGLVQVTEAHPDAILEHLTISSTHPGLVLQKRAFEIIHSFIATGRFSNYSE